MGNTSGARLSRGDRRRNEKLRVLRTAVPQDAAIVGIDLAKAKQAVVVTGADHQVLARRVFCCSAWGIHQALRWAEQVAAERGLVLVVACEPTGHRWKPLAQQCRRRGLVLVCVQPLLVCRERERDDYTNDRSDAKDATLIARLARELRCYLPVGLAGPWARLRHLGMRRHAVLACQTAARQQLGDLLEASWPAVLAAASDLESSTLLACLLVGCDPDQIAAMSYQQFASQVAGQLGRVGAKRRCLRVVRAVYTAAGDARRLPGEQQAIAERAGLALEDLLAARAALAETDQRMVGVLDALGLAGLCGSIVGLSLVGAAQILAQTGDPASYDTGRAWVKHAGICPRDNHSGTSHGPTRVSGPGPAAAAHRRLAGHLGAAAPQPGVRRPLPAPDPTRPQPAHRRPGPHRPGRRAAAPAVGGASHPHPLGPTDRRRPPSPPRHQAAAGGDAGSLARPCCTWVEARLALGNNPKQSLGAPPASPTSPDADCWDNPACIRLGREAGQAPPTSQPTSAHRRPTHPLIHPPRSTQPPGTTQPAHPRT